MRDVHPITFLLSADNVPLLKKDLTNVNIAIKEVIGRYTMRNGEVVNEDTIVAVTSNVDYIMGLAKKYNQESVLMLDCERNATFLYTNGDIDEVGVFKAVDKNTAEKSSGYTYCPLNNIYYTIVKKK